METGKLSQKDRTLITEHPLRNSFDFLREPLQELELKYRPSILSYDGAISDDDFHDDDSNLKNTISRLLSTLLGHEVAFNLRVKNEEISSGLITLLRRVRNGNFQYSHYQAVIRLIVKRASDIDIWNAVLDLIANVSHITPPTTVPASVDDTPITHSSASQQGSEQTQRLVEARIFEEIKDCTYQNVEGFFSKYFEQKSWSERAQAVYQAVCNRHAHGLWTGFPQPPVQDAVCRWWLRFQEEFLLNERGLYCTRTTTKSFTGSENKR